MIPPTDIVGSRQSAADSQPPTVDLLSTFSELKRTLASLAARGVKGMAPSSDAMECLSGWGKAPVAPSAAVACESLEQVRADLGECLRCGLSKGRTHLVFGVGSPQARLVFVGEGPGFEEDRQGEPFVGPAGQLLTKIVEAMGLTREQVYICNVIKCRPPENRNPLPEEIASCAPFLKRQLAALRPACICALGTFAAQTLLATTTPISKLRGRFADYNGIPVMPTYHPAFLLRNPEKKRDVWADAKQIMELLGLKIAS